MKGIARFPDVLDCSKIWAKAPVVSHLTELIAVADSNGIMPTSACPLAKQRSNASIRPMRSLSLQRLSPNLVRNCGSMIMRL